MESKDILAVLGENPSRRDILAHWNPEDEAFWKKYGERVAKQNLYTSTWALTLAFVAWTMWATIAAQLNQVGFHFTDNEIFTLAALPGLVGATGRLVYTYLPAMVGGRNWTFFSTALLLVPLIGLGNALTDTTTTYDTFVMLVAGIGIAGANFSSSMANIGFFFPKSQKGLALGINAGIGNLGVSLIYLTAPMLLGASFGGLFGDPLINAAGKEVYLQNVCYFWAIPTALTLVLVWMFMDNLPIPKQSPRSMMSIFGNKHTWLITVIYTCGFGSFIGYSAALALLVNREFPVLFFLTGFINAASFRMIPFVFENPVHASLVTGFTAAIAAYGAFFIPKLFGLSYATQGNVIPAFYFLIGFTMLTIAITWFFYARKGSGIKC